ncbi:hypothetical protein E4U19_003710 [Claviceps sp. Clav32 group G5]|nr:hypothetical protein E4U19_003710 [Claviceps sp. Clav32 group G5]
MASHPDTDASSPVTVSVSINGGTILGKRQASSEKYPKPVDIFYAIPYATTLRFQPPTACVPVESGSVLDARHEGKNTPQPMAPFETEEGILRVNVFRSVRDEGALKEEGEDGESDGPCGCGGALSRRRLPVMVYFHGGAYNFGDPLERDLVSLVSWAGEGEGEADMVVVSVGYRLGALGFPHEVMEEGGSLNLGLRDQRMGVEWVRRWIGEFGGDGGDVTMMGVSAGGHSIGHHLLHPHRLPFTKAILESASPTARCVLSSSHPRVKAQHESFIRALRSHIAPHIPVSSAPLKAILKASASVWAEHERTTTWPFQPLIDGDVIPKGPLSSLKAFPAASASSPATSILTGFCTHEGTHFVPATASTNAEFLRFFKTLIPGLSDPDLRALEELYPDPVTHPDSPYRNKSNTVTETVPQDEQGGLGLGLGLGIGAQFRRLYTAFGHWAYICPILHTAHVLSSKGHTVYLYEYAPISAPFGTCSHGDQAHVVAHEMDHLRGYKGLGKTAREMTLRWSRFIGSPTGDLGDLWPQYGEGEGQQRLLVFGEGNDEGAGGKGEGRPVRMRMVSEEERRVCEFWWRIMGLSQGECVMGKF